MTDKEAMQQALDALELHAKQYPHMQKGYTVDAITALSERLAREEQEPVAWLYRDSWGTLKLSQIMPPPVGAFPVYTRPQPAAQWVGLTDDDVFGLLVSIEESAVRLPRGYKQFARAIEAKLKERNQ